LGQALSSITYDSNSNRLTYGATSYTIPSTSNKMSAAGGNSISYSSTGNITQYGASSSFTYSSANQLATATISAAAQTYTYDEFGQRVLDRHGAGVPFVYNHDQDGKLLSQNNSEIDYAWLDGMPIGQIVPSTSAVYAILTDNLGTQQKVADSTKAIVWNYSYSPNGVLTGTGSLSGYPLRYPGQAYDNASGNHNYFRDFMMDSGRYGQVDPIGLGGGLNPYVYAWNNTYRFTDPYGLCPPQYANDCADESYGGDLVIGALADEAPAVVSLFNWIANLPRPTPETLIRENTTAPEPPATQPGEACKPPEPTAEAPRSSFPDRSLPRDQDGNPIPDPEAEGPYTQLGTKTGRKDTYPQAREFDADGNPVRDIDFTNHGRPNVPGHTNPHEHIYLQNPTGGTPQRGPAQPLW
jgi:RHS repeat-associated protein